MDGFRETLPRAVSSRERFMGETVGSFAIALRPLLLRHG